MKRCRSKFAQIITAAMIGIGLACGSLALAQLGPTANVAKSGVLAASSVYSDTTNYYAVENLLDVDTSGATYWYSDPAVDGDTGTVTWTADTDVNITQIRLMTALAGAGFNSVTWTFFDHAGTQVGSPIVSNTSSPNTTVTINPLLAASKVVLSASGRQTPNARAGFRDLKIFTDRPGILDPLGVQRQAPIMRDDELILFNHNVGNLDVWSLDTRNGSAGVYKRGTRPPTGSERFVTAAAGRIFGDPVEQVAVITRNGGSCLLQLMDMSPTPDGQRVVRGQYTFTDSNLGSDIQVAVADLDSVVTGGRRHEEVAIAYEVVDAGVRCVRVDVLTWRQVTRDDIIHRTVVAPMVLASVTMHNVNNPLVGQLQYPAGTTPNQMRLRAVDFTGRQSAPKWLVLATAQRPPGFTRDTVTLTTHTLAALASADPVAATTPVSISFSYDIGYNDWDVTSGHFMSTAPGDQIAVSALRTGGQLGLQTFYWSTTGGLADGAAFNNNIANITSAPCNNLRPLLLSQVPMRCVPISRSFAGNASTQALAVMAHTTRGPIVQTYLIDSAIAPISQTTPTWPTPAAICSHANVSAPEDVAFAAGNLLLTRSAATAVYPLIMIKPDGNATSIIAVPYLTGGASGAAVNIPLHGAAGEYVNDVPFMIAGDIDGDSGYFAYPNETSPTIYLGRGYRTGFKNVTTPRIVLQEPPKHADYIRSLGSVFNVSRSTGFSTQYVSSTGSAVGVTQANQVDYSVSNKITDSVTVSGSVEIPGIDPNVTVNVSGTVANAFTSAAGQTYSDLSGTTRTVDETSTYTTSNDDQLVFQNRTFDLWNYPVLGLAVATGTPPDNGMFRISIPGPDAPLSVTGGRTEAVYQPEHINGNILSYPYYSTSDGGPAAATALLAQHTNGFFMPNSTSIPANTPPTNTTYYTNQMFASTPQEYNASSANSSLEVGFGSLISADGTYATAATIESQKDISASASVEVSGSLFDGFVGVSGSVSGEIAYSTTVMQSFSHSTTRASSRNLNSRMRISVPGFNQTDKAYYFLPTFWFDKGGAARMQHLVRIDSDAASWWRNKYSTPDPALNLPDRIDASGYNLNTGDNRNMLKGYDVLDDNFGVGDSRNASLLGSTLGADGQQLTLKTRVYNLALANVSAATATNVLARFEAVEVDDSNTPIGPRQLIGQVTIPSIAGQANQMASVVWDTTGFGPCHGSPLTQRRYRVYVILDPNNTIANETHELVDRDNSPLISPKTGLPADMYGGQILEKGQNNLGWFPFSIGRGPVDPPNCQDAPAVGDAYVTADSLAVGSPGSPGGVSQHATVLLNRPIELRLRVAANGFSPGPRAVTFYNGEPGLPSTLVLGYGALDSIFSGGSATAVFTWTPTTPGTFDIYAQVASDRDTNPNNNTDSMQVTVLNQSTAPSMVFVDANAASANPTGLDFANALTSLDAALVLAAQNIAGATVKVAGNASYHPATLTNAADPRSATFMIPPAITVEGGYAGAANPAAPRNPALYITTLSGDIGVQGSTQDNSYHVVTFPGGAASVAAVLDGVTVAAGNASGSGTSSMGGGVTLLAGSASINNCRFTSNLGLDGAGLYANTGAALTVTGSTFATNTATGTGGGLRSGAALGLTGCTFSSNTAGGAGAVFVTDAPASLSGCTFSGNSSTADHGGALVVNNYGYASLDACRFTGNSSGFSAGAVMIYTGANLRAVNCLFAQNSANRGGALRGTGNMLADLVNCTFVSNTAFTEGGAFLADGGASTATNCIFSGNSTNGAGGWGSVLSIGYSIVQSATTGTGNIVATPLFVNAAQGDYHLAAGSPGIDAGRNTGVFGGAYFGLPSVITRTGIGSLLVQGTNWLYINSTDLGGPGGCMFSATINVSPTESITVRSGNGTVGGPDSQVNMLVGPADTGFAAALTPANFASARTGPDAILCTPNSAWATSIPSDPAARWISDVASGGSFGSTCLFAIPFTVNSADRSAASITFTWIVDNMIGFNPTTRAWESGVFINEVPLPVCNATDLDSMARFFDDPATPNTGLGAGAIDMGAFEFRGASGCPTFNQQPASITRTTGSTSTFTVAATGTPSPTYQWQRNNSNLANGPTGRGSTVSGATSPSLTISNTQLGDAGSYTCVATNPCGNAVSNAAILTVFCRSDFNRDEAVNSQDFFDYLTAFFGGLPSADINGDSAVNSQDFFDFLTAFFAGC